MSSSSKSLSPSSSVSAASSTASSSSPPSLVGSPPASLPYRTSVSSPKSQSTFLFIDAQADHAHNRTLRNQKQGFLLKNYHRKKKQESIRRLKTSKPAPNDCLRIGYTSATDDSTATTTTDGRDDRSDTTDSCSRQTVLRSEMWSLKAYLSQGYVDPFSASAIPMTDSMNLYFHHFRIHTIAACYPVDSARMSMWWWQKAITQPALLQALLFLTAGHQATLESINGISSRVIQTSRRDSLYLRGDTLKNLNDIMRDPVKAVAESTTLVVASLVAIEAVDANFEALEAHMRGLRRLIHLMGGLDTLDHMTISKIYQSDVKSAALNNSRPTFPLLARWRSEILQDSTVFLTRDELDTPKSLTALGVSIFNSPWYQELDSTMKTFLQVIRRLIIYYEVAQLRPSTVMPTDNDLFLVFEHQLLSASYKTTKLDDIHEPLRLSMLLYVNLRIWHFQRFPFMEYVVEAFQQCLNVAYPHLQTAVPELLFWLLYLGSLASQGYKCHPWFINGLIKMTHRLGLEEWGKARGVLKGFFYTDQPAERRAEEDLWSEVLSRASYPYIAPKLTVVEAKRGL